MKQTAVEWLYDNLKSHFEHNRDLLESVQFCLDIAKEWEKQQTIEFAEWCLDENHIILNDGKELLEIYKKEKGL